MQHDNSRTGVLKRLLMAFSPRRAGSSILPFCLIGALASLGRGAQRTEPAGDELWLVHDTYKVGFERAGATVVPFLGSNAPRNWPLALRVESVRVGERGLEFERELPFHRAGEVVSYDRGPFTELYRLSQDAIELAFQFDDVPRGGELVIEMAFESDLERWSDAHGLVFAGPDGGLHVGEAIVFDGGGRSAPVAMELHGDAWTLGVDASFLAVAEAPLLIDPLITTFSVDPSPAVDRDPDLAYDASLGLQVVCWEREFSASDRDVHGQALDATGATVQAFVLTAPQDDERRPRIAGIEALDRFLLVIAKPNMLAGRTIDLAGGGFAIGPPVAYAGVFLGHGLGGDAGSVAPYRYALVFQTTQGILGCQATSFAYLLDENGGLVQSADLGNDCDTIFDQPQVSKRSIEYSGSVRRWAVMARGRYTFGGSHYAEGGWLLSSGTYPSPHTSFGGVTATCAVAAVPPAKIVGIYRQGSTLFAKAALGSTTVLGSGLDAAVDYDGASVVAAYIDALEVVRATSYSVEWPSLVPTESGVVLADPGALGARPRIVATAGAGISSQRFLCAWENRAGSGSTPDIAGAVYESPGPGVRYCTSASNSVGPGARIHAAGNTSIALDQFELLATGCPPNQPGIFYLGQTQIEIPFGDGFRCIGGATRRIAPPLTTDGTGAVSLQLDFDLPYGDLVEPGPPGINYQFWYRDPPGGPSHFNLSDALHVEHTP